MSDQICLIFDVDDTLVDSETLCNSAYIDLVPEINVGVEKLVGLFRARKLSEILADIESIFECKLGDGFEKKYRAHVAELFQAHLKEMPGVTKALSQISHPMCVASNGPHAKITQALELTKLDGFFGPRVFSAYDINSWKPAPDLFLHAAAWMECPPERCIVVEDSGVGVWAGLAAGMRVLHYNQNADPNVEAHKGVTRFSDMAQLPQLVEEMI